MILERKEGRERDSNIDLLFHLFMHSLVASCMCPDRGIELTSLACEDSALTNQATQPGLERSFCFKKNCRKVWPWFSWKHCYTQWCTSHNQFWGWGGGGLGAGAASAFHRKQDAKSHQRADPWDSYCYFNLVYGDLFSETEGLTYSIFLSCVIK